MTIYQLFFLNFATYFLLLISTLVPGKNYQAYLPYSLIIFSFPHFMASYWIWARRVTSWKKEMWPIVFPILYTILFSLSAMRMIPLRTEFLVKATYYYLIYHFSRQLYGAAIWQSRKTLLPRWEKYLLQCFFLICGSYALVDLEIHGGTSILFYHPTAPIAFPETIVSGLFFLSLAAITTVTFLFLARYFRNKNPSALIPLLTVSVAWIWFIPPMSHSMIFFLPVAHALQYFPFIRMKTNSIPLMKWSLFFVLLLLVGWLAFRVLPFELDGLLLPKGLWPVFILTLLNNHHFVIDGRIWKLSDPKNQDLLT